MRLIYIGRKLSQPMLACAAAQRPKLPPYDVVLGHFRMPMGIYN